MNTTCQNLDTASASSIEPKLKRRLGEGRERRRARVTYRLTNRVLYHPALAPSIEIRVSQCRATINHRIQHGRDNGKRLSNGTLQACIDFIRAHGSLSVGVDPEFIVFTPEQVQLVETGSVSDPMISTQIKHEWVQLMKASGFSFGKTYRRSIFEDYAQAALTVARQIVEAGTNGEVL